MKDAEAYAEAPRRGESAFVGTVVDLWRLFEDADGQLLIAVGEAPAGRPGSHAAVWTVVRFDCVDACAAAMRRTGGVITAPLGSEAPRPSKVGRAVVADPYDSETIHD